MTIRAETVTFDCTEFGCAYEPHTVEYLLCADFLGALGGLIMLTSDTIASLRALVSSTIGVWTGCDWTTDQTAYWHDSDTDTEGYLRYDCAGLLSAVPVDALAAMILGDGDGDENQHCDAKRKAAELLARESIEYVAEIEQAAQRADDAARDALRALDEGALHEALAHIEAACDEESAYGDCPTFAATRDALRAAQDSADTY